MGSGGLATSKVKRNGGKRKTNGRFSPTHPTQEVSRGVQGERGKKKREEHRYYWVGVEVGNKES